MPNPTNTSIPVVDQISNFLYTTIPMSASYVASYFPIIHNLSGTAIGNALANIRNTFGLSFPSVKRSKIIAKEVALAQNKASLETAKKLLREEINKSLELIRNNKTSDEEEQQTKSASFYIKQNKYL